MFRLETDSSVSGVYPSSKRCHHRGALNEELKLPDRSWECCECGTHHHRDINTAWNILLEGIRMLRVGEVAGASVRADAEFYCADGTSVTAETPTL